MKNMFKNRRLTLKDQSGFTLIEILIVVILLGILATVIIPQVSVSSNDAKLNTLKTNLSNLRSVVELYYYQHGNTYPGFAVPTTKPADVTDVATAFTAQLARYTDASGNISNTGGTSDFPYGPYVKAPDLPENSFNNLNDVTIDNTETDITKKESLGVGTAWKFYAKTGIFMAADGAHDAY